MFFLLWTDQQTGEPSISAVRIYEQRNSLNPLSWLRIPRVLGITNVAPQTFYSNGLTFILQLKLTMCLHSPVVGVEAVFRLRKIPGLVTDEGKRATKLWPAAEPFDFLPLFQDLALLAWARMCPSPAAILGSPSTSAGH